MSPRVRVYLNVAIAAVAAVGITVGLTIDTRTDPPQPKPFAGKPPEPKGLTGAAGVAIEKAFAEWPHGSIPAMQELALEYPSNAIVQFYRGVALLWAGYPSDAVSALDLAASLGRNTVVAEKAEALLHPDYFVPSSGPAYPVFEPLEHNELLEQGTIQQEEGHQLSAEQLFAKAAQRAPDDPEAQVAAAVGLFDEANLSPSFARLKALSVRFPRSQVVHFYRGYLFLWTDQSSSAVSELETTVRLGASTQLGKAAETLLSGFLQGSSSSPSR